MFKKFKAKTEHARKSLTVKVNALLATLGTCATAFPEKVAKFVADASQFVLSAQGVVDPATLVIIGKAIAVMGVISIVVRLWHNSGEKRDAEAAKQEAGA